MDGAKTCQHRNPGGPLLLQSDGRWIHVSERKTQDGGTVGVFTDVTELKRAEEALREKTEFLALNQVITAAANEAAGVESAIQIALDQVCAQTRWPVGHAYMLVGEELVTSRVWHLDDGDGAAPSRRRSAARSRAVETTRDRRACRPRPRPRRPPPASPWRRLPSPAPRPRPRRRQPPFPPLPPPSASPRRPSWLVQRLSQPASPLPTCRTPSPWPARRRLPSISTDAFPHPRSKILADSLRCDISS